MAELHRRLPTHISKIYYPVDRRKYVNRALAVINPQAVVLVEAEIWPNFIWRVEKIGVFRPIACPQRRRPNHFSYPCKSFAAAAAGRSGPSGRAAYATRQLR